MKYIIIVKVEYQEEANAFMKENIDHQGGENTFTVPLSTDGENITHYWCSADYRDEKEAKILEWVSSNPNVIYCDNALCASTLLTEEGLQRVVDYFNVPNNNYVGD